MKEQKTVLSFKTKNEDWICTKCFFKWVDTEIFTCDSFRELYNIQLHLISFHKATNMEMVGESVHGHISK